MSMWSEAFTRVSCCAVSRFLSEPLAGLKDHL
jgi:hypothetical protein